VSGKKKVGSNAVEFDSKLTKGIISGLSALDDIEGLMIEDENTELFPRPESKKISIDGDAGLAVKKSTEQKIANKNTAAKKAAAVKAAQGKITPQSSKATKSGGKEMPRKAKPDVLAKSSELDYTNSEAYLAYRDMQVLSGVDDDLMEISFYVNREQLQKIKHLIQSLGMSTPEQIFNPGFGPHRQVLVPRVALRDYSQLLGKGIEMLHEVRFALAAADSEDLLDAEVGTLIKKLS